MMRIKRGGRELLVNDSEVAEYLNQGYSVIDDKGNVITQGQAMTYEQALAEARGLRQREKALTASLAEANRKIVALETYNAVMKKEIEELHKQIDGNDADDPATQPTEPEPKGKPKK